MAKREELYPGVKVIYRGKIETVKDFPWMIGEKLKPVPIEQWLVHLVSRPIGIDIDLMEIHHG